MTVKDYWVNSSPNVKRFIMAGAALSVFVVFGSFVAYMDRSKPKAKVDKTTSNTNVMMPSRRNTDAEAMAASNEALKRRIQQLETDRKADNAGSQEQIKQLRELMHGGDSVHREMSDLKSQISQLTRKLEETSQATANSSSRSKSPPLSPSKIEPLEKVIPRSGSANTLQNDGTSAEKVGMQAEKPAPAVQEMKLRIIGGASGGGDAKAGNKTGIGSSTAGEVETKSANSDADYVYLPMGAMIQGVLLNGLDAPTSGAAQKNPTPVVIRVKHDAILPNRARMDIKECFILASGYGVMSTERANLRTEGISCVREDGGVVETNLDGYVIGEDGKVGLRGRLVSKQGSMIATSLASGFLSGIGKSLQPTGVVGVNLNPGALAQTQSVDLGTSFESGLLGGGSNSLNQISKFYLDIAKEMVPVVEIDAGRPVTIALSRGGRLRFNRK